MALPKGYKVIKFNDVEDRLTDYHKHGARPGIFLGFQNMKDYYSMRTDGCTDWTGLPQSGKTELLLECLFNASTFHGWKHLLLVPDIGNCIEVMAILIHKYTGKTFEKKYPNYIDLKEAFNACSWLFEHFYILEKADPRSPIMSPVDFWNFAVEFKKENNIHTATIDSWKDLDHDYTKHGGTYAMYLSKVLPLRNALSETHNIHFHTVIHPKQPRRNKNGQLVHPQVDDMEGGAQWNNSGKTILSVHRATFDTKVADIQALKVKPRAVGKRGNFCLNFDPTKSRYFEMDASEGGVWRYAMKDFEPVKEIKQISMMEQNDAFLETKGISQFALKKGEEDLPF